MPRIERVCHRHGLTACRPRSLAVLRGLQLACVLELLLSWCWPGGAFAAGDVLGRLRADGRSEQSFELDSPVPASDLTTTLSAGVVTAVRDAGPGRVSVGVRAPHLVEALVGRLELLNGSGRRVAEGDIVFERAPPPLAEQRSSGPYELTGPKSMVLGIHGEASLSFAATEEDEVELFANVGTIHRPRRGADGRLTARYVPPAEKYPQVAIIAAVGHDRSRIDWVAIPLYGRPEVTTHSEPLSTVFVDVGNERHGPLRTDRQGVARFRVWVPPGIDRVSTVARDALGNQRSAPLDLEVPAFSRQLIICGESNPLLTVLAVSPKASPLQRPDFRLLTSLGSVGELARRAPGVFDAGLLVPDSAATGDPVLLSTRPVRGRGPGGECRSRVAGELPVSASLVARSPRYHAGGDPVVLGIALEYRGRRQPGQPTFSFLTSSGSVQGVRRVSDTEYHAEFTPADAFGDARVASVEVRVQGTDLASRARIELAPGDPATVSARMAEKRLRADGASEAELSVSVRDVGGNLTDRSPPSATATGRVSEFQRVGVGEYRATYTSPALSRNSVDQIKIRAGDASTRHGLELVGLERPFLFSARAGYFTNFARISTLTFAAAGAMRLPFERRLSVGVSVGYYQQETQSSDRDTGSPIRLEIASTPVVLQVIYELPLGVVVPYAGTSAGMVANWTGLHGELVSSDSVAVRPIVGVLGGLTVPLHSGDTLLGGVMAQAQYAYARVDNATVEGSLGGLDVTAGYQYEF